MPLSSSSTFDDVVAAYKDNASYDEDGDLAKAKSFRTACRFLLLMLPKRNQQHGGAAIDLNPEQIQKQLDAADTWINTGGADSSAGSTVDDVTIGPGGPSVSTALMEGR